MESAIRSVIKMSWPTLVIVMTIVIILRVTYIMTSDKRKFCLYEEIFELLFLAYLVLLFQLVTSQDLPGGGTNLMPFREILRYDVGTKAFYKQVFGNILLFIPLGYFATSYCKIKGLGTITLVSLLSSITIEVTQHYIGRTFDIDDIILNVVGGILGFIIFYIINKIKNKWIQDKSSILPTILSFIIFILILILIILMVVKYI